MKKVAELLSGTKSTIISGLFLVISLILIFTGKKAIIDPAWVTIIISGFPLLYSAVTRLIFERWISSALLISIAMIASIYIGEIFAAGEVAFIMAVGGILEEKTLEKAKKGLSNLISLTPEKGRKIFIDGKNTFEKVLPISEIKIGDVLRVLPGEKIPLDGKIIYGSTSVDQSILTGESLPVDKFIRDEVFCGTLNQLGSIDIQVSNLVENTSLQKMINLVKEAENNKAPMQKTVDKWAVWLVPIALAIAVLAFITNLLLGIAYSAALNRAVTVLVVFCPCALALATPTSIVAAIGQATKKGVIIKSGEALENLGRANIIAFDKTGTLTKGKLTLLDIISFENGIDEEKILFYAACIESRSEHPIGKAIANFAKNQGINLEDAKEFTMNLGRGVQGIVNNNLIICGNENYLKERNIFLTKEEKEVVEKYQSEGKIIILVAKNDSVIGLITLSDSLKEEVNDVISQLDRLGVETFLLTGDNKRTAEFLAKKVGIKKVFWELLPIDKMNIIKEMIDSGNIVSMVGDGVNDAAALKLSNVGISMGSMGSDVAIESSDIALIGDMVENIPYIKKLSVETLKTIKINITLSMIINAVAITLSVAGVLNPITGALVHNVGSVLVVLNAARLYDRKI